MDNPYLICKQHNNIGIDNQSLKFYPLKIDHMHNNRADNHVKQLKHFKTNYKIIK